MDLEQSYKTFSLYLAAFIKLKGTLHIKFLGLEQVSPNRKYFVFTPKNDAELLEAEFYSGGEVSAKALQQEIETLKDQLFGGNNGLK